MDLIGKYVVVRTYSAGVFFAKLVAREGDEVVLDESRRIWSWEGANTCSELALDGLNPKKSRVAKSIDGHRVKGWIEILPATDRARATYDAAGWA